LTEPAGVAVVGLGLMGASLALSLGRRGVPVVGVEPDPDGRAIAVERLGGTDVAARPGPALGEAALVVLAVPLRSLEAAADGIAPWLADGAVVTDLTSVKVPALDILARRLPGRPVVGGHPMAGRETAGAAGATADLFEARPWAIVAPEGAPAWAVERVRALARTCGAVPVDLAAADHDRAVAATSQLPYLVAGALARAVARLGDDAPAARDLVGPGLEGAIRLAGQPAWMDDACLANRAALASALAAFEAAAAEARRALVDGAPAFADLSERGRSARRRLLAPGS